MNKSLLLKKYILFDFIAALFVWVIFFVYRKYVNDIRIFEEGALFFPLTYYIISFSLFPFCCLFIHYLTGFYVNPFTQSRISSILTTLAASAIISISVFLFMRITDASISLPYFYGSLFVLLQLIFWITLFFRALIFSQIRHNFKTKRWTINTLIIGTGKNARKIAQDLEKHAHQHSLLGFVSFNDKNNTTSKSILGDLSQIEFILQEYSIQETIIVLEDKDDDEKLYEIINLLYRFDIAIQFAPRLHEILTGSAKISHVGIIPMVTITKNAMPDWESNIKRFTDILLSIIALFLLSPLMLYCLLRIKKESAGSAFYKQERIGRFGKPFKIIKFRTMVQNAENGVPQLSSTNDARITPFGSFLRKYRIDEFPQFWNVIKGDMSLVGPRPERLHFINQIIEKAPYYCLLYKIRPGITSWGPIKIGYSDSIEKMIERLNYDIIYLDNMSLITDLKILIYTVEIILTGKGI
jgi:exopolysaccharide biosynthesis polyprenyl glycosylphosphotransferase